MVTGMSVPVASVGPHCASPSGMVRPSLSGEGLSLYVSRHCCPAACPARATALRCYVGVGFGELVPAWAVGSGGPHVAAAALSHHVRHVVGVRSKEQVFRVAAWRPVTLVTNLHPDRDRPIR